MRTHPYHHSVWLDVFGVLFVGAVLLGGAGYLLYHVGGAETGFTVAAVQQGASASAPSAGRRSAARRSPIGGMRRSPSTQSPLRSRRPEPTGGSAAPFSESWRRQATPNLSGNAGASGAGQGSAVGGSAEAFGPSGVSGGRSSGAYASSRRSSSRASSGASGSEWRAEAKRFASRAQALSRELGQAAQDPVDRSLGEQAAPSEASSGGVSAEGPTSSSTTDPPTPEQPTLPIDDHVHWLLAAGLLWGVWRLARG